MSVPLDVTDPRAVEMAVDAIQRRLGPLSLLVNNAGVWGPLASIAEVDPGEWWRTMEINLRGSLLCARAVLPGMIAGSSGRIINISSHAGVYRWPHASAYAISKTALIKLTEHVAAETKGQGIAVFAVHPGLVRIGLTEVAMGISAPAESSAGRVAAWVREQVEADQDVPPERGADLVVALASGRADVLSGRYLTVDENLDALVAQAAEIRRDDLYTLRLRDPERHGRLRNR
jgi:NAD(P)-dependent dehydrogenase (short-subunit alcohol dehydrogenase family)